MSEKCFCHLGKYQVKDAVARKTLEEHTKAIEECTKICGDVLESVEANTDVVNQFSTRIANIEKRLTTIDTRLAQLEDKTETKYYTVSYYDDAGVLLEQSVCEENTTIKIHTMAEVGYTVPTGHTFAGWRDSNGKSYTSGASVVIKGDITLTARINANECWVDYKYNNNMLAGDRYSYGDVITVCTPDSIGRVGEGKLTIPDGFEFKGWACSDGKTYYGGETITLTDNIVFTGKILGECTIPRYTYGGELSSFTLTFEPDRKFGDYGDFVIEDGCVYLSGSYMDAGDVSPHYYKLPLAYEDNSRVLGTDKIIPNYTYVEHQDLVTVTFEDTYTGDSYSMSVVNGNRITLGRPTDYGMSNRDGYTFTGWLDQDDGVLTSGITYRVIGNTSFRAQYVQTTTYSNVTFVGYDTSDTHTKTVETGTSITFETPSSYGLTTPSGYTFLGWGQTANAESYSGVGDSAYISGDRIFYAIYMVSPKYTVTFNDGHTGAVETTEVSYGDTVILRYPSYYGFTDKSGYDFAEWIDHEGGGVPTGVVYTITEDTTFTAHWIKSTEYSNVTFVGYSSSDRYTKSVETGTSITFDTPSSYGLTTPSGYTFLGWGHTENAESYSGVGDSAYISGDRTFYAVYMRTPVDYTVTYRVNGQIMSSTSVTSGSAHSVYGEPDSVEYPRPSDKPYFAGWRGSDGALYQPGDSVAVYGNFSFSAEFKSANINM